MNPSKLTNSVTTGVVAAILLVATAARAQTPGLAPVSVGANCTARPTGGSAGNAHPVCDVRATITRGPYLHAPTDSSATITWMTDLPSHVRVAYGIGGALNRYAYSTQHGMVAVGTLHNVRLRGLKPGQQYDYRVEATPVFDVPAYWPRTGVVMQSPVYAFTTFDPQSGRARRVDLRHARERWAH